MRCPYLMCIMCFSVKAEKAELSSLNRALGALNTHLASNTFLVGHSVILADIVTTSKLYAAITQLMTKSFTSEFPHAERYFWNHCESTKFQEGSRR